MKFISSNWHQQCLIIHPLIELYKRTSEFMPQCHTLFFPLMFLYDFFSKQINSNEFNPSYCLGIYIPSKYGHLRCLAHMCLSTSMQTLRRCDVLADIDFWEVVFCILVESKMISFGRFCLSYTNDVSHTSTVVKVSRIHKQPIDISW